MKHKFVLNAEGLTDVGLLRENNEDYFVIKEQEDLFVVADGMGGAQGGEVASELAVESVINNLGDKMTGDEEAGKNFADMIKEAIQDANDTVIQKASADTGLRGMGATIVLALFEQPDVLHIANVGDARGYLFRDESLSQLTKDHSAVGELVRSGKLSAEEARVHRLRNIVTQAIGIDLVMRPHQETINLKDGDIIVLCSDGLWDMLPDEEIGRLISQEKDPGKLCRSLVDSANQADGEDNITVIVISVAEVEKDKSGKRKSKKKVMETETLEKEEYYNQHPLKVYFFRHNTPSFGDFYYSGC